MMFFGIFGFGPNAASNPVISGASTTLSGGLGRFVKSIVYSATGIYTIVFGEDFGSSGPMHFHVSESFGSIAEHFQANQIGAYDVATKTLVIQTHRQGVGREVPAAAGARINVVMFVNDTGAP